MPILTVVILESTFCSLLCLSTDADGVLTTHGKEKKWYPSKEHLSDRSGRRLIEELGRRIRIHWKSNNIPETPVVVSLPGTLNDEKFLVSSSRLGIQEPIDFSSVLQEMLSTKCLILHDTDCLIRGELKYGDYFPEGNPPSSLVYILADEGIGSRILINGQDYVGAGTAGLLGRMIVHPDGTYSRTLRSSGSLEAYSSRPAVSRRMVEVFNSETNKKQHDTIHVQGDTKFRQALKVASEQDDWSLIGYERMSSGIADGDPIAINVVDNAARLFGYSINSVITLLNPQMIILAGGMINKIQTFADLSISYARQLCWPNAWNNTDIRLSENDRLMQQYGAFRLALPFVDQG